MWTSLWLALCSICVFGPVCVSWFVFLLFRVVFAIRCQILASVLEQAGARPLNLQIYPTMECLGEQLPPRCQHTSCEYLRLVVLCWDSQLSEVLAILSSRWYRFIPHRSVKLDTLKPSHGHFCFIMDSSQTRSWSTFTCPSVRYIQVPHLTKTTVWDWKFQDKVHIQCTSHHAQIPIGHSG